MTKASETPVAQPPAAKASKQQRHRSPNYPLFDLKKAVERIQQMYDRDKAHKVPVTVLHDRWGYKAMSGALKQAIGALKSYGLITVEGEGAKRFVAVSERGRRILLDAPDKAQSLKDAAVGPALFKALWEKYAKDGIPADDVIKHHLIFDRKFNDESVGDAIARFKATIDYAKLSVGDKMAETDGDEEGEFGDDAPNDSSPPADNQRKGTRRMPSPGAKEFVYPLEEGNAVLTYPGDLSEVSVHELKDWLDLVMKKIKRAMVPKTASIASDDDGDDGNDD